MFLQNILQKRLKDLNEEEERYLSMSAGMGKGTLQGAGQGILSGGLGFQTDGFDRTTKTIGSIRNRQVNFLPEHTFFNTQTHMRPKAQVVRHIVKDEIDKDLLGTKKAKWSQSVARPLGIIGMCDNQGGRQGMAGDFREYQQDALRFQIRQGFHDKNAVDTNPQTTYAGCDTRDVYYHGWDVSIEKTPPRDRERQYQIERAYLCDKTGRAAEKIVRGADGNERTQYGIRTDTYMQPEFITRQINDKLRMEKEAEVVLWDELMNKQKFDMPGASQNRLDAIVHRKIQDIKHGKKEEQDPEMTFKPNVLISQASKPPAPEKPKKRGFRGGAAMSTTQKSSIKDQEMKQQQEAESSDEFN